jgi:alkaline phosphatase D
MRRRRIATSWTTRRELLAATGAAWLAARALPLGAAPVSAPPQPLMGPMVGHTTDTTASLWVSAEPGARLSVAWRPASAGVAQATRTPLATDRECPAVQRATLTGLAPRTRYLYRVSWNEHSDDAWTGSFRTAPTPGTPGRLRIGTSSCMKPEFPGVSFGHMLAEEPDFHVLLGDNAYHDSTRTEVIWAGHRAMRAVPQLAALLRHVPTYAIWDDHDYAGDDTDGTQDGKHRSFTCFRQLFANPAYGLPDVPGIFSRFAWGDVEVFLLDVRFHRSPNKQADGPEKRVLGAAQWAWFAEALSASKATFKLVCSGSVLDAKDRRDTWGDYPTDRARLFALLAERKIGGVVFLTGDLHYCTVQMHPPERTGTYAVPEVVSSGIANSKPLGFALLDVDTAAPDPTLTVRLLDRTARVTHEQALSRSALGPR